MNLMQVKEKSKKENIFHKFGKHLVEAVNKSKIGSRRDSQQDKRPVDDTKLTS